MQKIHFYTILRSKEVLSMNEAAQKARELAVLQEKIYDLISLIPNKTRIYDVCITRGEKGIGVFLDMPLFYGKEPTIYLSTCQQSFSAREEFGVNTDIYLNMEVFSDLETLPFFEKQLEENAKIASLVETRYYFDLEGKYLKMITIPASLKKRKKPLYRDKYVSEYLSEMTLEDFLYASRALTLMKQRLEDYLSVQKLQISQ